MYKPDICLYHADCDDGFGAAWAIWKRWPECQFFAATYGKALPIEPVDYEGKNVLMVDFSAPAAVLEDMVGRQLGARSVIVLDHHESARQELAAFYDARDGEVFGAPVMVRFDMEKSGARLAWEFAFPDEVMPPFLHYIEDRDLWRKEMPLSEEFTAALRSYPRDFRIWDMLRRRVPTLLAEGEPILRAYRVDCAQLAAASYLGVIGQHTIPIVNCPRRYASDVGHLLLEAHPTTAFAATWAVRGDGKIEVSMRARKGETDVSQIARGFGGGGHKPAAGFTIDPKQPTDLPIDLGL